MEYIVLLLLVAALLAPLYFIYRRQKTGKPVRGALIGHIISFFALCILSVAFAIGGSVSAASDTAAAAVSADGMRYLAAALSVGISCIGGGIAVASSASAALGALSENEKIFGKALIFVGLAEGVALYGLLVALMLISAA